LPLREPPVAYPSEMEVRRVRSNGEIRWRNGLLFVSEVLVGEPVGLLQIEVRHWKLYFGFLPLAILDDPTRKLQPIKPEPRAPRSRPEAAPEAREALPLPKALDCHVTCKTEQNCNCRSEQVRNRSSR